jgi:hypothetical protein
MYQAGTEGGLVYIVCTCLIYVNMYFTLTNDYRLRLTNERPDLSSERAPKETQDRKLQTSTF